MRKIIVFNLLTLDGYYAGPNDDISWHHIDDEFNEFAIEHTASFGALIFGKTTYKLFEDFWPQALKDPKTSPEDRKIAQMIDDVEKIVFSKSIKDVSWKNSKLFHDINPDDIKKLKNQKGRDMAIFGSGTIVQQFTNLGLVDEYRFIINPVVLGSGKQMFANLMEKLSLKLLDSRTFKNGNVLLYYAPEVV